MKGGEISHKTYSWRLLMKKKLFWVRHLPLISWPKWIRRGWSLCWLWSTYLNCHLPEKGYLTRFQWRFFCPKNMRPFYLPYVLFSLCHLQPKKNNDFDIWIMLYGIRTIKGIIIFGPSQFCRTDYSCQISII